MSGFKSILLQTVQSVHSLFGLPLSPGQWRADVAKGGSPKHTQCWTNMLASAPKGSCLLFVYGIAIVDYGTWFLIYATGKFLGALERASSQS
ncbi:hypothetical protein DSO57_1009897 [Entomophthora muscae]|uniref:Uncharacterized protein n=1 Tax=Entomophthora muscae TaxID=34485 RepID=A0ACC2U561_9FUNG|nr:hypothetical protein DSO57_1009897 [Entomophthora muscae]